MLIERQHRRCRRSHCHRVKAKVRQLMRAVSRVIECCLERVNACSSQALNVSFLKEGSSGARTGPGESAASAKPSSPAEAVSSYAVERNIATQSETSTRALRAV